MLSQRFWYSIISLCAMLLVFVTGTRGTEAAVPLQTAPITWTPSGTSVTVAPGGTTTINASVRNDDAAQQTFAFSLEGAVPAGWTITTTQPAGTFPPASVTLNAGQSQPFTFTLIAPATVGSSATIVIRATRQSDGQLRTFPIQAQVQTSNTFTWTPLSQSVTAAPGGQPGSASLTLSSSGVGTQTYNITTNIASFSGWSVSVLPSATLQINGGGSTSVQLQISAPVTATASISLQTTATRQSDGTSINAIVNVAVTSATATPTRTVAPTSTAGPTCPEGNRDPGNDFGSAKQILIDTPNNHGICTPGDEDWFKFAAIGGKVYTPDITRFDAGLDLSLELFDSDGNRLAFNDDFFARTPQPTGAPVQTPLPTRDIAPRIQSWRAPKDGIYYVRVRDTANAGGGNRTYTFVVFSESYGPTPPTVTEICRDLFEEDGLPEEAKLITSNEIQRGHVICPAGDADWVKFFGKTGKTYYIYTDTRPYRNNPSANPSNADTEAGADTVIFLADRDGVSIIDFNDDIESAEGSSTDSQIRFVPRADGFYFVQVKNTGDIGNQFIRYDLVLTQCVPGRDDCGRARNAVGVAPTAPPAATQTPITFNPTVTSTSTTPTLSPVAFLEQNQRTGLINGPLIGFVDPAFEQIWNRTDQLIAKGQVNRSWLWGPRGLMARSEGYSQAAGGLRQVQYFDKGRMELGSPGSDARNQWFVTSGLLSVELISGRMQVGDRDWVQRGAADIPIAGDLTDTTGPTYGSFAGVTGQQFNDRTGVAPRDLINRTGQVSGYAGPERTETRLAHFVPESGHNIASVFWDYMNANGPVVEDGKTRQGRLMDWVFTMGYPISEPYWIKVRVAGQERDVLVQVFERRVLTYDPANPRSWRVEMGNIGRHYYRWRYGEELPSS